MTNNKIDYENLGKYISLILRHKPEVINITLDEHGYALVSDLIQGISKTHHITKEILDEIVNNNNKKRYAYNEDKTKIRANQGHSIKVDVDLTSITPPDVLYHGTATRFQESIEKDGLVPKSRLHVHLSLDVETAKQVGMRHGKILIYKVDAKRMYADGFKFYLSLNNVYLTDKVPAQYLKVIDL